MRVLILFLGLLVSPILAHAQSPYPYQAFPPSLAPSTSFQNTLLLYGAGQTMSQPSTPPPVYAPSYRSPPIFTPIQPTTHCILTNPGAMQSLICR